jgi:hypothetical protein
MAWTSDYDEKQERARNRLRMLYLRVLHHNKSALKAKDRSLVSLDSSYKRLRIL